MLTSAEVSKLTQNPSMSSAEIDAMIGQEIAIYERIGDRLYQDRYGECKLNGCKCIEVGGGRIACDGLQVVHVGTVTDIGNYSDGAQATIECADGKKRHRMLTYRPDMP